MKFYFVFIFIFSLISLANQKEVLYLNIPEMDSVRTFILIHQSIEKKYDDLTFEFDIDSGNLTIFSDVAISNNALIEDIQKLGYTVNPMLSNKILVKVDGIVCSFCLIGIKKNFEKIDHVINAEFNLNIGVMELTLKPNKSISDDVINKIFLDAGYEIKSIIR